MRDIHAAEVKASSVSANFMRKAKKKKKKVMDTKEKNSHVQSVQ